MTFEAFTDRVMVIETDITLLKEDVRELKARVPELAELRDEVRDLKAKPQEQEPPSNVPIDPPGSVVIDEEAHGFGWALTYLKLGHKVRRRGWVSERSRVWLDQTTAGRQFVVVHTGGTGLYFPNMADLLATDWEVVE
jgi:hypothetical protein